MITIRVERIIARMVHELIIAPWWWYTDGLIFMLEHARSLTRSGLEILSPGIWWRYLFVPMYGQYNWQGRIISFVIRLVQGCVRGVLSLIWIVVVASMVAVWCLAPVVVIAGMWRSLA